MIEDSQLSKRLLVPDSMLQMSQEEEEGGQGQSEKKRRRKRRREREEQQLDEEDYALLEDAVSYLLTSDQPALPNRKSGVQAGDVNTVTL